MNKSLEEQEKRFLKWVETRDDDWWEDQARISIWDFRIMQDFFKEEIDSSLAQYKREIREKIKKMKVPSYPAEGPQAGEMTVMARMGYQDAISDALKELEI